MSDSADPEGYRSCSDCRASKPFSEFTWQDRGRQKRKEWCRDCERVRNRHWKRLRTANGKEGAYYTERRRQQVDFMLKRAYGIGLEEYERLFDAQKGCCAICNDPERERPSPMKRTGGTPIEGKRLAVDHDHSTGLVRGLLCGKCNQAIGAFRENPSLMRAAALYIESSIVTS